MTTNNDNVWALDATTGAGQVAMDTKSGGRLQRLRIVANRGVAFCDGHVFC